MRAFLPIFDLDKRVVRSEGVGVGVRVGLGLGLGSPSVAVNDGREINNLVEMDPTS